MQCPGMEGTEGSFLPWLSRSLLKVAHPTAFLISSLLKMSTHSSAFCGSLARGFPQ